tara:strand:- start:243 stop:440 length:198 start_codon:yes stop_codon:yes gene_type:complete
MMSSSSSLASSSSSSFESLSLSLFGRPLFDDDDDDESVCCKDETQNDFCVWNPIRFFQLEMEHMH